MYPAPVPSPFTVAIRAVWEGLKTMSETVDGGPTGGVVCLMEMGRRPPRALRPFSGDTEKQVMPATLPPLMAQAGGECVSSGY
jgi:hypothetical protein